MNINSEGLGIYRNLLYAAHPRLVNDPCMKGKVSVIKEGGSLRVKFEDKIYKNSPFVNFWFSDDFSEAEILASIEVEQWLKKLTGYKRVVTWSN